MSLATDYPEMWPDRTTIKPANPSTQDNSGGRIASDAVSLSGLPCSVQPGGMQDVMTIGSVQVQIETKVYYPDSPGPLTTGTKIVVDSLNGIAPERQGVLTLQRMVREGLADLTVWRADCLGRA